MQARLREADTDEGGEATGLLRRRRARSGTVPGRSGVAVSLVIVGALVLGACGGSAPAPSSTSAGAGGTTTTQQGQPAAVTGCGTAVTSGTSTLTLSISGRSRTVIVHVPSGYSGATKVPLVLNMHGSGSTAAAQEVFTGMNSTADANGFVVAYPQALIPDGSGFDWNVPGVPLVGGRAVPAGSADDVSFLTQLVGTLEHRYCIDPKRVYATGFSGGARTASQLACDASTVFAAVAPVSGLRRPTPCPANRAVPVVTFHGTADPVDPYTGHGQAYWTYSVPQAAVDWAAQDGCSPTAVTSQPATGVTLTQYGSCRSGASVELYTIAGEGHDWPGGPALPPSITRLLGPQSQAVSANDRMWAFFATHPLP